ncbi:MAG: rhodanese-like domain-containing protein [Patescibacteria group bacterium]|jgi:rhodanese-related sulfurtransferase
MSEPYKASKKETIMLIFAVIIVVGGIIAIFVKPQWKLNIKPVKNSQTNLNESQSTIPTITASELKEKIDNQENIYILDVQSEQNYLTKHIPGSINIPYEQVEARIKEIPNNKEIITTCTNDNTCKTSTKAAELLSSKGLKNVKSFKEGVTGWEEQNYPIISGFDAIYKSINLDQLKQKIDNNEDIVILDIREKDSFDKSHIKNAINMPFEEVANRIKELPRNKELIVYDETGNRSKLIVESLTKKGFTQAINLINGYLDWQNKNYPIE